jgi:ABC-type branched-subunit amino acid transport system permease subunit
LLKVAGILDIIIGSITFVASLVGLGVGFYCGVYWYGQTGGAMSPTEAVVWILTPMAALVASLLAILGGVHTLKRDKKMIAIIGSACAALTVLGIPALIIVLSLDKEFDK